MGNTQNYNFKAINKQNIDKIFELNTKIQNLEQQIIDQQKLINLLKFEKDEEHIYKNGIIQNINEDIEQSINDCKKNKNYEGLVLSGGGVKGVSYCGVIEALDEESILFDNDRNLKIKKFAGTSAGSIICALLAVGYETRELKKIMIDLDIEKLLDDKWGIIRDAINFVDDYGIAPGKFFYDLLGDLIEHKTGNKDYTIDQLYNDKNITLVTVGTDLSTMKSVYFYPNHQNEKYRNIPIRKAVRISMSIPFMFEPVVLDKDYFVDGGVLDNYPLHAFDGEYPGDTDAKLNLCPPNPKILGIKIITENDIEEKKNQIDCIFEYSFSYINAFLNENDKRIMTPSYWIRTCTVVTPNIPLSNFSLSRDQKINLINIGKISIRKYFK